LVFCSVLGIFILTLSACSGGKGKAQILAPKSEPELRKILGIPDAAEKVVVFSQSVHIDLDWQMTHQQYYDLWLEKIFTSAFGLLQDDPRYSYSLGEIYELKYFLNDHPELLSSAEDLVRAGRLRIAGGGLSSPDTLLPTGEALIRDWLQGINYTRDSFGIRPVAAWQPDSFGHSPSLPAILAALGYEAVSFARVDGNETNTRFQGIQDPLAGSTAEMLRQKKAIDFIWDGDDGSEVLAHWMPNTYGQGDSIDTRGTMPLPGGMGAVYSDPDDTNAQVQKYIDALEPISPTPYLFVPVGTDFQPPKPGLPDYVEAWNRDRYPGTGVYAVQATFEDYIRLVGFHRDELQHFQLDPNPYFMGFYASRPALKEMHRKLTYRLAAIEKLALIGRKTAIAYPEEKLKALWQTVAFANHHDFLTGTAPDAVYQGEQIPMLENALTGAETVFNEILESFTLAVDTSRAGGNSIVVFNPESFKRTDLVVAGLKETPPDPLCLQDSEGTEIPGQVWPEGDGKTVAFVAAGIPPVGYGSYQVTTCSGAGAAAPLVRAEGNDLVLENDQVRARLDSSRGYAITEFVEKASGHNLVTGPSNDPVLYYDEGGLWRLGNESEGKAQFTELARGSQSQAQTEILAAGPVAGIVKVTSIVGGEEVAREYRIVTGIPRLDFLTTGKMSQEKRSLTVKFATAIAEGSATMAIPCGEASRPGQKLFTPTFWPGLEWFDLSNSNLAAGFLSRGASAWHYDRDGEVELILLRNTPMETWDLLGARGTDSGEHTLAYALYPHSGQGWSEANLWSWGLGFNSPLIAAETTSHFGSLPSEFSMVQVSDPRVLVTAVKQSEDGKGIIIRLFRSGTAGLEVEVKTDLPGGKNVYAVNAAELDPVKMKGSAKQFGVQMDRRIKTVLIK
jgi:alpha-mannosidase